MQKLSITPEILHFEQTRKWKKSYVNSYIFPAIFLIALEVWVQTIYPEPIIKMVIYGTMGITLFFSFYFYYQYVRFLKQYYRTIKTLGERKIEQLNGMKQEISTSSELNLLDKNIEEIQQGIRYLEGRCY